MLIEKEGDIFTSEAQALGHGVNVVGVIGGGISGGFIKNYPIILGPYKDLCDNNLLLPGEALVVEDPESGKFICNLASQDNPGPSARPHWVISSLFITLDYMVKNDIKTIAIPQIGCGIGGLDWDLILPVIKRCAQAFPEVDIEVWTYKQPKWQDLYGIDPNFKEVDEVPPTPETQTA